MRFDPFLAELRFGYGLSPSLPRPTSGEAMLARLAGPDEMAVKIPLSPFTEILGRMEVLKSLYDARRDNRNDPDYDARFKDQRRTMMRQMRQDQLLWLGGTLTRRTWTRDAFRERLVAFWADHFTARGTGGVTRWAMTPYVESAIRPHVTGSFRDLLIAAVKAPLMLEYLDQHRSRGPNSVAVKQSPRNRGLNENLAREILELHTLGVGGPYTQQDVRELAELLTGLSFNPRRGTVFHKRAAEPGEEVVLGKRYGHGAPAMDHIDAVLGDLAVHPATGAHIGRKLAVHFVGDTPDAALVAALEARFRDTGGDLMALYEMLLAHASSWSPAPGNVRPPLDWVSASCRALAVPHARLNPAAKTGRVRHRLLNDLARMGQPYEQPGGPDGWPEDDAFWLTPQGIAARLQWALFAPRRLYPNLPDPREFVETALGPRAGERLRFIAGAAESRSDGIGLILASPEFQRS